MKKKAVAFIKDILIIALGSFIYASAVSMLISANRLSAGGFTGISTLANHLWGIPSGAVLLILNIPVIIAGFIKLGARFIAKTALATVLVSLSLEITDTLLPRFATDKILAGVFGGILMGVGLSLVLLRGATTGGVDIIAKLINKRFRHLTVGRLLLIMDAAVIALAALVYRDIESALYSVISLYASASVMDTVLYGADRGKLLHIISSHPDEICHKITTSLERGVTKIAATGGFTGQDRTMLMCTLRRHEVSAVYAIIEQIDPDAFVVVSDAGEILGEGFKRFEKK